MVNISTSNILFALVLIVALVLNFNWPFQSKSLSSITNKMAEDWKNAKSVYDFTVKDIKGEDVSLEKYKGSVLIIVNVASKCGYTSKHYKELVELDEKYRDKGLKILAFPCNQFGGQEPGDSDSICSFTAKKNVKFDIFEKVDVNGNDAHPLWKYLKSKQGGLLIDSIKWNFTKFIVDKNGQPVERHAANVSPLVI
ncbi:PREDICTED: probable phospholipid hydroperoxide glutathione peroxidase isoform X1 [Diuraphis noxia]|uniref:probable phospholipid hydroperoxide glutathione peroxidase isoform X1 n=1 Tax=Diuraphis noxia TaxID=143948 RepID=UPI000763AB9C|nr:PREDICTED: probable phospholipid hydroperoxide glutathione peroxidase isoform X1 [Diuraphis noxia]